MHVGVSVETYDGVFELFWLASMCTFSLVKIFWILYFKKRSHRVRRFILLLSKKERKKPPGLLYTTVVGRYWG